MQKGCIARTIQSNETSLFPLFFSFYSFIGAGVVLDG